MAKMEKDEFDKRVRVTTESEHLSTSIKVSERGLAVADSNALIEGEWWLTRVRVPDEFCGQGIGTLLVQRLQEELAAVKEFTSLRVSPGGYNSDIKRQRKFYESCGFMKDPWRDDVYVWKPGVVSAKQAENSPSPSPS